MFTCRPEVAETILRSRCEHVRHVCRHDNVIVRGPLTEREAEMVPLFDGARITMDDDTVYRVRSGAHPSNNPVARALAL